MSTATTRAYGLAHPGHLLLRGPGSGLVVLDVLVRLTGRWTPVNEAEPNKADIAAIEAEWPLIAAEVDLVEAECRLARTPLDTVAERARRRAMRSLLAALVQHANQGPIDRLPCIQRTYDSASGTRPDAA